MLAWPTASHQSEDPALYQAGVPRVTDQVQCMYTHPVQVATPPGTGAVAYNAQCTSHTWYRPTATAIPRKTKFNFKVFELKYKLSICTVAYFSCISKII